MAGLARLMMVVESKALAADDTDAAEVGDDVNAKSARMMQVDFPEAVE
jgi:hypothetical protein